jgi:hypothetical protein
VHTLAEVMCEMLSRRMLNVSGSWYLRGSRLAAPNNSSMALPAGTVVP